MEAEFAAAAASEERDVERRTTAPKKSSVDAALEVTMAAASSIPFEIKARAPRRRPSLDVVPLASE